MQEISNKVKNLLSNQGDNYIMPFFWQHGEEENVLRHYMEKIESCGIKAVCVESRPHPDFCGPKWWHDMDIILDEARKRNMKVWILDDSHFPTGYANGKIKDSPVSLRRQFITYKLLETVNNEKTISLDKTIYGKYNEFEKLRNSSGQLFIYIGNPHHFSYTEWRNIRP